MELESPRSPHPKSTGRILVVDDHPVVRAGLAMTLSNHSAFTVCGEAEGVLDALDKIRETSPDLVLTDLDLGGRSGLELVQLALRIWPGLPFCILSAHSEHLYAERALKAGARGYLMKNEAPSRLIEGLHTVLEGGVAVGDALKSIAILRLGGGMGSREELAVLSDRELEVFREIGAGATTRKIADKLALSVKTVETHIAHIKRKLKVESAVELRHKAYHSEVDIFKPGRGLPSPPTPPG